MPLGTLLALAMLQAAPADPLAAAWAGKVQCYSPNVAAKACRAIGAYRKAADGGIINDATTLIVPSPAIIMKVQSPVHVAGDAVCGPIRRQDLDRATLTMDGKPLSPPETAQIMGKLVSAMSFLIDHETCSRTIIQNGKPIEAVSVDGKPMPALSQPMIWVSPAEGYRVAP